MKLTIALLITATAATAQAQSDTGALAPVVAYLLSEPDNCPDLPNSDQTDTDGDGIGDACDDSDGDGVNDNIDRCPETMPGDMIDVFGCSENQLTDDSDGDGVPNYLDRCPNTPSGETANANGCGDSQLNDDTDGDGVPDYLDRCPGTPASDYSRVNIRNGCGPNQDFDGDGISDDLDRCPRTPSGEAVNDNGCADSQLDDDTDGDGVPDNNDLCPGTPPSDYSNVNRRTGCGPSQDFDGDGVSDDIDRCLNTPSGETPNANGCSSTQLGDDTDGDGVVDNDDICPETPSGATVDVNGCGPNQDLDGDGVPDNIDNCPVSNPYLLDNKGEPYQADIDNDGEGDACDDVKTRETAQATGKINGTSVDGDEDKAFVFDKLDDDGQIAATDATTWDCVNDKITGLMWEVKTNEDPAVLRDKDGKYTHGSSAGSNTDTYIAAVNAGDGLCGYNDWRLPATGELVGLIHYGTVVDNQIPGNEKSIAGGFFPNSDSDAYWSADVVADDSSKAYRVGFGASAGGQDSPGISTGVTQADITTASRVRLVRTSPGGKNSCDYASRFDINETEETVIDNHTGLMWTRCPTLLSGADCTTKLTVNSMTPGSSLNGIYATWENAKAFATAVDADSYLGSSTGWRLPNVKELNSIVALNCAEPTINEIFVVSQSGSSQDSDLWTSSVNINSLSMAWRVSFSTANFGAISFSGTEGIRPFRIVRTIPAPAE